MQIASGETFRKSREAVEAFEAIEAFEAVEAVETIEAVEAIRHQLKALHMRAHFFCKNGPFPASISLFSSFQQLTENVFIENFCCCLDSNCGPLASEATVLPTDPQPLPICFLSVCSILVRLLLT